MERELIIHIPIEGPESIVEIEDDEARTVLVEPDHLQCLVLHLLVVFHEKVFAALMRQSDNGTRVRWFKCLSSLSVPVKLLVVVFVNVIFFFFKKIC